MAAPPASHSCDESVAQGRGARPPETWTLTALVAAQGVYFRYGVIHVRKWIPPVSVLFVPVQSGDTGGPRFQRLLELGPPWIVPGGHQVRL